MPFGHVQLGAHALHIHPSHQGVQEKEQGQKKRQGKDERPSMDLVEAVTKAVRVRKSGTSALAPVVALAGYASPFDSRMTAEIPAGDGVVVCMDQDQPQESGNKRGRGKRGRRKGKSAAGQPRPTKTEYERSILVMKRSLGKARMVRVM